MNVAIGRLKGDWRAWKGVGREIEGCHSFVGRLESLEETLESLDGRLKASICECLEGRLKASMVMFNHHWRDEEVGFKAHSCFFFF
jgi:hypothetical protein